MSEVIPSSGLLRAFVDARFAPEKYYKVLLYEKEWNSVSLLAIYNAISNAQVTKAWFPTSILVFFHEFIDFQRPGDFAWHGQIFERKI